MQVVVSCRLAYTVLESISSRATKNHKSFRGLTMDYVLLGKIIDPIGIAVSAALTYKIKQVKYLFIPVIGDVVVQQMVMVKMDVMEHSIKSASVAITVAILHTAILYRLFKPRREREATIELEKQAAKENLLANNKYIAVSDEPDAVQSI